MAVKEFDYCELKKLSLSYEVLNISQRTIERALVELQTENKIQKIGRERSTKYQLSNEFKP
jgi:DeoR/GlpR family transcriptional regulator of sugar metabolism